MSLGDRPPRIDTSPAHVEELERENARLRKEGWRRERARLVAALRKYGTHQFPCPALMAAWGRPKPDCTCGLDDALRPYAETKEVTRE
jgi:hypothetical protein